MDCSAPVKSPVPECACPGRSRMLNFKHTPKIHAARRSHVAAPGDGRTPTQPAPVLIQMLQPALGILFVSLILLAAGCATKPHSQIVLPANFFPADAFLTQRGVLTVLGRQFTLNGYLASSTTKGRRLIVTENFGNVLADVLIKTTGEVFVMRSSRAFKPRWIHDFVAADVRCICGDAPAGNCPGRMLSPTHFVIERRWYKLDLQIVETKPGPQRAELFDETKAEKR